MVFALLGGCGEASALDHYVSLAGGHISPFTSWTTAATNIQAAVDAASTGDLIWVTNGIYAGGGKVMAGDLTNRVALDKAVTLKSVNGPSATTILGLWGPATPGPAAVRCAWLTNGATISGFTLSGGATRNSGDSSSLQSGGGAWCAGTNAVLENCAIVRNAAIYAGGGTFGCKLKSCLVKDNYAAGAGAGGGAAYCNLNNCTVIANQILSITFFGGGGAWFCNITNSIVYYNKINDTFPSFYVNSASCTTRYSCSTPLESGTGNISAEPQFLVDAAHLASTSPCRGSGTSAGVSGTDIDSQAWANPPSMGCDEWHPEPVVIAQPRMLPGGRTGGAALLVGAVGQVPIYYYWTKDGTPIEDNGHYASSHTTSPLVRQFGPADAGLYQVVVSNAFGMATSQLSQVTVYCVDAAGSGPAPPYSSWATAATAIQDAVDVAVVGGVVVVTNGIYATGGRSVSGGVTNRVVLAQPVTVLSVNGPDATFIEGQWDPVSTNGAGAVRCAWMNDAASLGGFTLRGGATASSGALENVAGGGVWCATRYALVAFCTISNNVALYGGGARSGNLRGCILCNNLAKVLAGGAYSDGFSDCFLENSLLTGNSAGNAGGGSYGGAHKNCTLIGNLSATGGGGNYGGTLTNCIIYFNSAPNAPNFSSILLYCCSPTAPSGSGNISADPQLVDGIHIAVTSPCRGTGNSAVVSGTDIDGESWAGPPSIGCDEVWEAGLTGQLSVALSSPFSVVAARKGVLPLQGQVIGRAARLEWSFGDGPAVTNTGYITSHTWTNPGDYTVVLTAFNADNPGGVFSNLLVHVVPLAPPMLATGGMLAGTNFNLQFPGQPGVTYVVEQATNLTLPIFWQTLKTLSSTGEVMQVTDTRATNRARFYRCRIP